MASARERRRYASRNLSDVAMNVDMGPKELEGPSRLSLQAEKALMGAARSLKLSMRGYRTVKLSRTIADLSDEDEIAESHIIEALQ